MRYNIKKGNSSKAERKFYEMLKELKIKFKHRWRIGGHEVDFIVGKYAIEISGHEQDTNKNIELSRRGFVPIHFSNNQIDNEIKIWLKAIHNIRTE